MQPPISIQDCVKVLSDADFASLQIGAVQSEVQNAAFNSDQGPNFDADNCVQTNHIGANVIGPEPTAATPTIDPGMDI